MDKLLVILGPTATGKTDLAINLAKKYGGEIISADSRQVYKGMDIGTGKDIDKYSILSIQNSKLQIKNPKFQVGYRLKDEIPIWLVDIVNPDYQFNVGEYTQIAHKIIKDITNRKKLPIVVGGTGLYIKSLIIPMDLVRVPPNESLRKELDKLSTEDLKKRLAGLSKEKWESMNNSDRNNPRRLVRAIEIAQSNYKKKIGDSSLVYDYLLIGLTTDMKILEVRIQKRVKTRVDQGIIAEINSLISKGFDFSLSSFSSCGYGVWNNYIETKCTDQSLFQKAINNWVLEETQYAKRQMTFFKKMKDIEWFDSNTINYELEIGEKVQKWYNLNNVTL